MVEGIDGDVIGDAGLRAYGDAGAAAIERATMVYGDFIAHYYRAVEEAVGGDHA